MACFTTRHSGSGVGGVSNPGPQAPCRVFARQRPMFRQTKPHGGVTPQARERRFVPSGARLQVASRARSMMIPQPDRDGFSSFPPASFCLSSHPPGTWVRTGRAGASLPDLACTGVPKHVDWGGGSSHPGPKTPCPGGIYTTNMRSRATPANPDHNQGRRFHSPLSIR